MFPIIYSYKNLNSTHKKFLQDYFPKKMSRFKNLIKPFKREECRLEVKIEKFVTKAAYKVELILHLPRERLMAAEDDHTIAEAIDLALDKLIIQLRKLVDRKQ